MDIIGFSFDPFYLDLKKQSLQKNNESIKVSLRTFKLLQLLASASPDPVSKEQLNTLLWPNTTVSEWSLARLVSDTRILLGDNGEQQKYIQTVRGAGFCMPNVIGHEKTSQNDTKSFNKKWSLALFTLFIFISSTLYWQYNISTDYKNAIQRIAHNQDNTYTAFKAQLKRRNQLATMLNQRLKMKRQRQWEMFFSHYHAIMDKEELFVCSQIRAITNNGLFKNNLATFNELKENPNIYNDIALTKELYQHLDFWLKKYHSVFKQRDDMCLLYVGVEDGVPYPSGVDKNIKEWLETH